mmetsp:Transcript_2330/g.7663  ORF Transcript_2330/g.7663 Transcript_2330/m.7663 type:complete len:370 (+) Transcript_2330:505-1614(+)
MRAARCSRLCSQGHCASVGRPDRSPLRPRRVWARHLLRRQGAPSLRGVGRPAPLDVDRRRSVRRAASQRAAASGSTALRHAHLRKGDAIAAHQPVRHHRQADEERQGRHRPAPVRAPLGGRRVSQPKRCDHLQPDAQRRGFPAGPQAASLWHARARPQAAVRDAPADRPPVVALQRRIPPVGRQAFRGGQPCAARGRGAAARGAQRRLPAHAPGGHLRAAAGLCRACSRADRAERDRGRRVQLRALAPPARCAARGRARGGRLWTACGVGRAGAKGQEEEARSRGRVAGSLRREDGARAADGDQRGGELDGRAIQEGRGEPQARRGQRPPLPDGLSGGPRARVRRVRPLRARAADAPLRVPRRCVRRVL